MAHESEETIGESGSIDVAVVLRALHSEQRLLRRLLALQERERRLLAYDLHDGFVQDVVGAKMLLDGILSRGENPDAELLTTARGSLERAIEEGRRLIGELRPPAIDELGVVAAIEYLVDEARRKANLTIAFTSDMPAGRLPALLEGTLFRITQEAINNIQRHSRTREAAVSIRQIDDRVQLEVSDKGVGFDLAQISQDRFGLEGIRERARLFGGSALIESHPGQGTRVAVELPLVGDFESSSGDI